MSDLTEAIEKAHALLAKPNEMIDLDDALGLLDELTDKAGVLLEAEQVQWCEEHESALYSNHLCDYAWNTAADDCSIVPKLLVDV